MSIFEEVTFTWQGDDFTVPPDKVMRLIAKVSSVMTLKELVDSQSNPDVVKIAEAYTVALNYAGARVNWEVVYDELIGDFMEGSASASFSAIESLLAMMIPPKRLAKAMGADEKAEDSGNSQADSA